MACSVLEAVFYFVPELLQTEQSRTSLPAAGILDRLKAETRSIHQRLERDLRLIDPQLSRASYCETLKAFYGFYKPFEARLIRQLTPDLRVLFQGRAKTPRLVEDLEFWNLQAHSLSLCSRLPELSTLPAILGSLYVTEGATLGGQIISRHLQSALGLSDGRGYSFFRGYGAETGSMWNAFRAALIAHSSPAIDGEIIQGAKTAFEAMHRWLFPGKRTA